MIDDAAESHLTKMIEDNVEQLEEYFINQLEYDGIPITKDNAEDLFSRWLEDQTIMDLEYILE